ncbi:hypothetical protein IM538_14265 [Cytobacillus suaedae]|nr:hypothetical protein IM538_14265 [Cytobacillus suaedae]
MNPVGYLQAMDARVGFVGVLFVIFLVYYTMNFYFPKHKKLKYYISLCFMFIGIFGWLLVFLGIGWLGTAVVSSAFLLLSLGSIIIAGLLDWIMSKSKV